MEQFKASSKQFTNGLICGMFILLLATCGTTADNMTEMEYKFMSINSSLDKIERRIGMQ
jgi:hypothetical protein